MKYKGIRRRQPKHYRDEKRRLPPIIYTQEQKDVFDWWYNLPKARKENNKAT